MNSNLTNRYLFFQLAALLTLIISAQITRSQGWKKIQDVLNNPITKPVVIVIGWDGCEPCDLQIQTLEFEPVSDYLDNMGVTRVKLFDVDDNQVKIRGVYYSKRSLWRKLDFGPNVPATIILVPDNNGILRWDFDRAIHPSQMGPALEFIIGEKARGSWSEWKAKNGFDSEIEIPEARVFTFDCPEFDAKVSLTNMNTGKKNQFSLECGSHKIASLTSMRGIARDGWLSHDALRVSYDYQPGVGWFWVNVQGEVPSGVTYHFSLSFRQEDGSWSKLVEWTRVEDQSTLDWKMLTYPPKRFTEVSISYQER